MHHRGAVGIGGGGGKEGGSGYAGFGQEMEEWEALRREARQLEGKIEEKVQAYSKLGERLCGGGGGDHRAEGVGAAAHHGGGLYDSENPPIAEQMQEEEIAGDIENLLMQLGDTVERMQSCVQRGAPAASGALLQRYREILFDYRTDFRKVSGGIQRAAAQRQREELFRNAHLGGRGESSDTDFLLRERGAVQGSLTGAMNILGQAFEARESLRQQRDLLTNAGSSVAGMIGKLPGVDRLIDAIGRQRFKEQVILAAVIAFCISFTVWWLFLS